MRNDQQQAAYKSRRQPAAGELAALYRIAAFSARLRGHELGEWQAGDSLALAICTRCHAELRVYYSQIQPEMEGAALIGLCGQQQAAKVA